MVTKTIEKKNEKAKSEQRNKRKEKHTQNEKKMVTNTHVSSPETAHYDQSKKLQERCFPNLVFAVFCVNFQFSPKFMVFFFVRKY